jgi:hypothetical protein
MKNKPLFENPYKFAAIGGIFWGSTLCLATVISTITGYGAAFLNLVGGIYPGYEISYPGSLEILFFGFMDGFMLCFLFAFFSVKKKKEKSKKP